jgi:uncharacterized membrane protein
MKTMNLHMHENVGRVERIASLALGAGLAALMLKKRSLKLLPLALPMASMFFRGSTGYCPAYEVAGLSTADTSDTSDTSDVDEPLMTEEELQQKQEEAWQRERDEVAEASEESFPASDPPSFSPGTAT